MGNDIVMHTAGKLGVDKGVGALRDRVLKETMGDAIEGEAAKDAGLKTFKSAFSWAGLFLTFVDTYSKAVKAANLENVRRDVEVCPHIGGCEGIIHAQTLACNTTATVWQAHDGYWYFHPQINYRVRQSMQVYRSTRDGGWRIERLGKPDWVLQDCLACVEAHSGG